MFRALVDAHSRRSRLPVSQLAYTCGVERAALLVVASACGIWPRGGAPRPRYGSDRRRPAAAAEPAAVACCGSPISGCASRQRRWSVRPSTCTPMPHGSASGRCEPAGDSPRCGSGCSATYRQPLRMIRSLAHALDRAGVRYALVFVQAYGVLARRPATPMSDKSPSSTLGREPRPAHDRASRRSQRVVESACRLRAGCRIRPLRDRGSRATSVTSRSPACPRLREVDVPDVMRVVAADLYRTLDATPAARRWTRRHPDAKVVAFPVACSAR